MHLHIAAMAIGTGLAIAMASTPKQSPTASTPTTDNLPRMATVAAAEAPKVEPPPAPKLVHPSRETIYRAVGHSEGNLDKHGTRQNGYYGHTDPGNHVPNIGAFSYQKHQISSHMEIARQFAQCAGVTSPGNLTPQCADEVQFVRLKDAWQSKVISAGFQSAYKDVQEVANFYDLNTQSPRASADLGWWLNYHRSQGLAGRSLIIRARVDSFCTERRAGCQISASGFGHSRSRLTRDQTRRVNAIHAALNQIESESR